MKGKNALYSIVVMSIAIGILITGCGGGGVSGFGSGGAGVSGFRGGIEPGGLAFLENNDQTGQKITDDKAVGATVRGPVKESGTLTVTVQNPGMGILIPGNPYIPGALNILRVTIPGKSARDTLVASRDDIDPLKGGNYSLSIANVPSGAKKAIIETFNSKGELLAQKNINFYMTAAGVSTGTLELGIGIDSKGSCTPSPIIIPLGTTLYFENYDTRRDHTVMMNAGAIVIGPIASAKKNADGTYTYSNDSYIFNTKGKYTYVSGYGGPGFIEVYGPPVLSSIADADGNNRDIEDNPSPTIFTLYGSDFGESAAQVNGSVTFTDINTSESYAATISTWQANAITGSIILSAGKYRVTVSARGMTSREELSYYKGLTVLKPIVTEIQPQTIKGGDVVTITGQNFGAVRGPDVRRFVNFGGVNAITYNSWSDTKIECIAPSNAPTGNISVTVEADFGTETFSSDDYFVTMENYGTPEQPSTGEIYVFITCFGGPGQ